MRLLLSIVALVITQMLAFGIAHAEDAGAPKRLSVDGVTEKVCQLTGDVDWETGKPTAAGTLSNFGLDAVDLGYPVEHGGKLILLFGDTWPPRHGGGAAGEIPPDDAVGITRRVAPPNETDQHCLDLDVHSDGAKRIVPATIIGAPAVKQGFFNVPTSGVSVGGELFAAFWTDHCADSNPLVPSPDAPLKRPTPEQAGSPSHDCPETDDRNSLGRAILARSDNDGLTFKQVGQMPIGFVYPVLVSAPLPNAPGLISDLPPGVFVFGVPRYRASVPYLAFAPAETFSNTSTWRYFTGRDQSGKPHWASFPDWLGGAEHGGAGQSAWKPPGEAEVFTPSSNAERCIGEFSVTWNQPLGMWLMLYNCDGIEARMARDPWGPWSAPVHLLGTQDGVSCRLVMAAGGCGDRRDYWPTRHPNGKFTVGGFYAPYVLNRYTTAASSTGPGRAATIYWLVSTWNPYQVTVMRSTLVESAPAAP